MKRLEFYGLQVKALKMYRGHEGEPLRQGNLYIDNKRVGMVSDGDWGGPMSLHVDTKFRDVYNERMAKLTQELKPLLSKHLPEFIRIDEEFIADMLLTNADMKQQAGRKKKVLAIARVMSPKSKRPNNLGQLYMGELNRPHITPEVLSIVKEGYAHLQYALVYGRNSANELEVFFVE